ncbi:MFS transporter [Dermacoccaceae bacterium W4C1]
MSGDQQVSGPSNGVVRDLWWPVLVPSFIYSVGAAAIVPAQVLTGLHLGMDATSVSWLVTWLGVCAVLGSVLAGYLVQSLGEQRALGYATAVGCVALVVMLAWIGTDRPGAVWVFGAALSCVEVADGIWSLARQNLVAERTPDAHRAVAMNTYGGSQRIGRVVGPLITSLMIALGPVDVVYAVHIAAAVIAFVFVCRAQEPAAVVAPDHILGAAAEPAHTGRHGWPPGLAKGFVLIGLGVTALSLVRTDRDLLLPLWGADHLALDGSTIALVVGLCAALELLFFYPAGVLMDRIGRLPIVATCLIVMGIGFAVMWASPTFGGFLVGAALLGIGNGVGAGIIKTLGTDLAPRRTRAQFLGWWNALSNCGALLAPALTAATLTVGSMHAVMLVAAAVSLIGAAWMLWWMPRLMPGTALRNPRTAR